MKFFIFILTFFLFFQSCMKGKKVDLVIHNAKIYTVDQNFSIHEAIAIKNGKIVEIGPERQILNKYRSDETIDVNGKEIYPGFTDSHGHLLELVDQRLNLDLSKTKSFEEVLFRLEKYASKTKRRFIVGKGWDETLWKSKEAPKNEKLNKLFADIPVLLIHSNNHIALINDCLLKKAKLNPNTSNGIISDKDILIVKKFIPEFSLKEKEKILLQIQEELFQYGITSVHEAGINYDDIKLFESLIYKRKLYLNIYAMLHPSAENLNFAAKNGIYKNKNLMIRSFIIGDKAFHGFPIISFINSKKIAHLCENTNYQMNLTANKDSIKNMLEIITETFKLKKDHRWRIENIESLQMNFIKQLISNGAFPSLEILNNPNNQTSSYKSILDKAGFFALGSNFPYRSFDPFLTIDLLEKKKNNQREESVSFQNCIMGMTIWPAFASFQEKKTGSLEKNKDATFVIFEFPIQSNKILSERGQRNFAFMTFIKGKKVYSAE